ncbi:MAG: hypothetical protein N2C14_11325, partial [Planctomycetales bacterium]
DGGCVANVTASRLSYHNARSMQVWTPRNFAALDFGTRTCNVVDPSQAILQRQVDVDQLSAEEKEYWKEHLFDELFPRRQVESEPCDQLTEELNDFIAAVRESRSPRACGRQAAEAVVLAEWIVSKIETHSWNGADPGSCGPRAAFMPHAVTPAPHWRMSGKRSSLKTPFEES